MIYVNNSATTWPKPENVYQQVNEFFRNSALNPGRSGTSSFGISPVERKIFKVRKQLADLIGTKNYAQIIFTSGATHSLNIALKGILKQGDHVITTCLEHNSVLRPLKKLEKDRDIKITVISFDQQGYISPTTIEKAITERTRLIVTTHASNVIGTLVDLKKIGQLARQHSLIYLVDAAQSAGVFELDVKEMGIDLLALAGHKSLYGPAGIGALYVNPELELDTLIEGGTGTNSLSVEQPLAMPDKYESGTLNNLGIVGLGAGLEFINQIGMEKIREHELDLVKQLLEGLQKINGIKVYGPAVDKLRAPVVSLELIGMSAAELGHLLENEFEIRVRSGLHCAPLLHRALGTEERGLVRISFSYFNTKKEVEFILQSLAELAFRLERRQENE